LQSIFTSSKNPTSSIPARRWEHPPEVLESTESPEVDQLQQQLKVSAEQNKVSGNPRKILPKFSIPIVVAVENGENLKSTINKFCNHLFFWVESHLKTA